MFATFVDWKLLSQWESCDPNLELFDKRLFESRANRSRHDVLGGLATPTYDQAPSLFAALSGWSMVT